MSHLLALEWDAHEARLVLARRRGQQALIERAVALQLYAAAGAEAAGTVAAGAEATGAEAAGAEAAGAVGPKLAAKLTELLKQAGVSRAETLVAVGRSNIELRLLSVPPVPPDELPDVVRFQALKQFASVGDNWPIDYVPLSEADAGPLSVLAAAIAPDIVEQVRTTCAAANLTAQRLVLRPFAAASLWQQHQDAAGCALMVDLLAEEGDLTVMVDGHVAFIRTVRLPSTDDQEELARAMFGEIRRTIAAASNQLGGRKVDRVVLCGSDEVFTSLQNQITQQTKLPCEIYDPFAGLELSAELSAQLPARSGRFAPLLGMVTDEAAGLRRGIDFLHPRKRPEPPSRRRQYALAAGAAAAVALGITYLIWSNLAALDSEISLLKTESTKIDTQLKKLEKPQRESGEVDEFVAGDVIWLDELCKVSLDFLPPDKAIVSKLSGQVAQNGGGNLTLEGRVADSTDIEELESRLRDEAHRVVGTGSQYDNREGQYPWTFKETLVIQRSDGTEAGSGNAAGAADPKRAAKPGGKPEIRPEGKSEKKTPPDDKPKAESQTKLKSDSGSTPSAKAAADTKTKLKTDVGSAPQGRSGNSSPRRSPRR
ncbi:MAG: type IV pilus biogenesis protein PilM [Planctomycetota bacterium]